MERHKFAKGNTPWNKGMSKEEILKHYKKECIVFKKGRTAWNKDKHIRLNTGRTHFKKGNHPTTEFKKGHKPWTYIDGQWNKRKRDSNETNRVWCQSNNIHRVPSYCLIHHIDRNPLNNHPENLQLMTRDFHNQLHNEIIKIMKRGDIDSSI